MVGSRVKSMEEYIDVKDILFLKNKELITKFGLFEED
jgi:hypothetical protein